MWQQSLPLDHSPNLSCGLLRSLDQAKSQEAHLAWCWRTGSPCPPSCSVQLKTACSPGQLVGTAPSFIAPSLHCDHSGSSVLDLGASLSPCQPLSLSTAVSEAQRPGQRGGWESTQPALCVTHAGPAGAALSPSLLPPCSAPSPEPPKPIWRPQGPHCQWFSCSLSPEQIVWELCQFLKKMCFVNRGRSLFYTFC